MGFVTPCLAGQLLTRRYCHSIPPTWHPDKSANRPFRRLFILLPSHVAPVTFRLFQHTSNHGQLQCHAWRCSDQTLVASPHGSLVLSFPVAGAAGDHGREWALALAVHHPPALLETLLDVMRTRREAERVGVFRDLRGTPAMGQFRLEPSPTVGLSLGGLLESADRMVSRSECMVVERTWPSQTLAILSSSQSLSYSGGGGGGIP